MDLPSELTARMPGYRFDAVVRGESGSGVWRCSAELLPDLFIKAALLTSKLHLEGEAARLRWMHARELSVPVVRDYGRIEEVEYLVLGAIPGADAADERWAKYPRTVAAALGAALAQLHRTPIADCPFDHRIAWQLHEAGVRLAEGRVVVADFDESRIGRPPSELYGELLATVPAEEDLVLVHGDFCLPNIILRASPTGDVEVAALIDCNRAGISDRYQDLALAVRSIRRNLGPEWIAPFLDAYGLESLRDDKVEFFTLLDEFF